MSYFFTEKKKFLYPENVQIVVIKEDSTCDYPGNFGIGSACAEIRIMAIQINAQTILIHLTRQVGLRKFIARIVITRRCIESSPPAKEGIKGW